MFDLRDIETERLERIAPEPLLKVIAKLYNVAGHVWVELELKLQPITYDASKSYRAAEHTPAVKTN